ncbi:MAG: hypothetical protein IPP48_00270 [Chitinophagaceae bacterium]|nr:hypothetical protein [Chitinophagaceae bacterium]
MNFNIKEQLPVNFNANSKVWVYQSSRFFNEVEALQLENILHTFVANWKSHGDNVKGFAQLFFNQFIVLMADETSVSVGGCSTDTSVHLIKEIEQLFKTDLLNRQNLAFIVKDKIQLVPLAQLGYAVENDFITGNTLYFNNTILTKKDLEENWIIPIKQSWLKAKVPAKIG